MGRRATTLDEQLILLRSRGMILDLSEEKTKEILADIGYYRLGYYWHPFEIDTAHNFALGTKFSTIIYLYYLDADLRNVLIRYINRVEIHFRTKVVYLASNFYPHLPAWFSNNNLIKCGFISKLKLLYTKEFIKKNKVLRKHHQKYSLDHYAPAWKTLELLTFGEILYLYRNIVDDRLRSEISQSFGIKSLSKFESLIDSVRFLRNASAHGNVLFDYQFPKGIPSLPFLKVDSQQRHQLYTGIRVISFLLNEISANRKVAFENRLKQLFEEVDDEQIKIIIREKIGYKLE
jgi:abortive infection bacteriophage resistance protein